MKSTQKPPTLIRRAASKVASFFRRRNKPRFPLIAPLVAAAAFASIVCSAYPYWHSPCPSVACLSEQDKEGRFTGARCLLMPEVIALPDREETTLGRRIGTSIRIGDLYIKLLAMTDFHDGRDRVVVEVISTHKDREYSSGCDRVGLGNLLGELPQSDAEGHYLATYDGRTYSVRDLARVSAASEGVMIRGQGDELILMAEGDQAVVTLFRDLINHKGAESAPDAEIDLRISVHGVSSSSAEVEVEVL